MHWLLAGYIWLYIHRPFEIWTWLGDLRVERVYVLAMVLVWFASGPQPLPRNRLNWGVLLFTLVLLLAFVVSPFQVVCQPTVEDYLKTMVFYVLLLTSVRTERQLRFVVIAFLVSMALYMGHSLWEYRNGRHNYRMGTVRMVGVDQSFSDPNSFAGTICYALPFAVVWFRNAQNTGQRIALAAYVMLSATCVLLTGSRAGFIGLLLIFLLLVSVSKRRVLIGMTLLALVPIVWGLLPEDRRNRFRTIIDSSQGPHTAQSSADSRILGFWDGIRLWQERPFIGVGPGAHPAVSYHGRPLHNLYGQLVADLGTLGALAFGYLLFGFATNFFAARKLYRQIDHTHGQGRVAWIVTQAVGMTIVVMLLLGMAGHTLYRYHWIWMAAFQVLAFQILREAPRIEFDDVEIAGMGTREWAT